MDQFGIGSAVLIASQTYFACARRTGRTTQLVESVKDGDRIVFLNAREADRVQRLLRERMVDVDCVVVPPDRIDDLFGMSTSEGRTIFDHSWLEDFYTERIRNCWKMIDHYQTELSGYGEAHRVTRRRYEEMTRRGE